MLKAKNSTRFFLAALFILSLSIVLSSAASAQNNAVYFDGATGYVSIGNGLLPVGGMEWTFEVWVQTTSTEADPIFSQFQTYDSKRALIEMTAGGVIRYQKNIHTLLMGTTPVNDGQWHHVALAKEASGNLRLYIDGILDATGADTSIMANQPSELARIVEGNGTVKRYFTGYMDDLRVWAVARTDAEITANWNADLTGNEGPYVTYLKMNESGGSTLFDSSPSGRNGTLHTGGSLVPSTVPFGSGGAASRAVKLNGSTQYVAVSNHGALNPGQGSWTMEAWVKYVASPRVHNYVIGKRGSGYGYGYQMKMSRYGAPSCGLIDTNSVSGVGTGVNLPMGPTAPWFHITCVFDRSTETAFIYVHDTDGNLVGSAVNAISGITGNITNGLELGIGARSQGTHALNAEIDEVRIWNRALSPAEIDANLFQSLSGSEPGLIGNWKLEDNAADSGPYGLNGAAVGGPSYVDGPSVN